MNIVILQCDSVLDKFQKEFGNYPEMMQDMFGPDTEYSFKTFDVREGEYPESPEEWDLFLISGSKASVYDDDPWIQALIQFVQRLDTLRKKTFGICFGHQVMAMATGGLVEKSNKGWGVGLAQNRIISESGWMKTALTDFNVIVSHQDQVTVLSEGATIIATSDFCPNFMVQWSPWLFSIQGHPEWSKAYSKALVNDRRDRIPVDRVTRAMASYDLPLDADQVVKWILQFAS